MSFLRDAAVSLVVSLKGYKLTRDANAALHVLSNEIARSIEVEENFKNNKHSCPDWDYMIIDKNSPEFDACLCYRSNHDFLNFSDDTLIEEVRRRGFTIRDAQISPKREWIGLTYEERSYYLQSAHNTGWWAAAKIIEAKLKEKNI